MRPTAVLVPEALPRLPCRTRLVLPAGCALGESPRWLSATAGLRWVDAERGELHAYRAGRHERWPVGGGVLAAVVPDTAGGLVLLVERQVRLGPDGPDGPSGLDGPDGPSGLDGGGRCLAELPDTPPGVRFNDAEVGPDGRLWAGTVHRGRPGAGALWSVDRTGRLARHWTGISHGNGIAFGAGGDVIYVVDSGPGTLARADFDPATGQPGRPHPAARMSRRHGIPDGLAVDAEGDLWLAVWGGGCVLRMTPDGVPVGRVVLPERNVTSCAFADDLLVVTTAADDVTPGAPGGAVHLLDVGRRGLPTHRFPAGPFPTDPVPTDPVPTDPVPTDQVPADLFPADRPAPREAR